MPNVVVEATGAALSTLLGYFSEPTRTQYLGVTDTPATQTTASLGTGTYTLSVLGSGSALASGGTATITGAIAATAAAPNTFTVTVAGTVVVTKTGTLTRFQLENGSLATSYIPNAGVAGTTVVRNVDREAFTVSGNLPTNDFSIALNWTPSVASQGTVYLWGSYVDASNSTAILHDGTNLIFRKRIAGVNTDATIAFPYAAGTTYKLAARASSITGQDVFLAGVKGTNNATVTACQLGTTFELGNDGNGGSAQCGALKQAEIWKSSISDTALVRATT